MQVGFISPRSCPRLGYPAGFDSLVLYHFEYLELWPLLIRKTNAAGFNVTQGVKDA